MMPSRRGSASSLPQARANSQKTHSRVTSDNIRAASLRRWDGLARITTDWINLFYEPELCFDDGDLLIYLREPCQSSRGPAFRVHKLQLKERGFDFLLDRCIVRPPIHPGTNCLMSSCYGCDVHPQPSELYIPAPSDAGLDEVFDHHITTRNFFAWLYNLPLAGRALGQSLVTLKERIDYYRPHEMAQSSLDIVSFAETQGYLDFRECVDHALAALLLAECLQIEDLWIDAFAHCAGLSHRGLNTSLEYWAISYETRLLIQQAQFEMEDRLESVRGSTCDFFEHDLSDAFLGLSQNARDHFDHFRSWLHSYHIDQYGFWPPNGFEDQTLERDVYASMYSDFRKLYDHLVDPDSTAGMMELHLSASGGVCVAQNIQAFDARHRYETLSKTMPLLPMESEVDTKLSTVQRRKAWNPITKRKMDRDTRKCLRAQALIAASNRDWAIMECPLVRCYSEFETAVEMDDSETISVVEGRKIRWILVYAILQTLTSVLHTPAQVRNAEGLTYLLCCRPPTKMPWQSELIPRRSLTPKKAQSVLEPDTQYAHSNSSSHESLGYKPSLTMKQIRERGRQSLPAIITSVTSRPSTARTVSLRRFMSKADLVKQDISSVPKSPGYCEILVQGYGNGLNEIYELSSPELSSDSDGAVDHQSPKSRKPANIVTTMLPSLSDTAPSSASTDRVPGLSPASSGSVSRESSNASMNDSWSKELPKNRADSDITNLSQPHNASSMSPADFSKLSVSNIAASNLDFRPPSADLNHVFDEEGLLRTVHFNTETWDNFLAVH